jgi:hypothetical protein
MSDISVPFPAPTANSLPLRLPNGGSQDFFECFSWNEFDRLTGLDLDLFAGLWIDTRARLACGNFESPKSD